MGGGDKNRNSLHPCSVLATVAGHQQDKPLLNLLAKCTSPVTLNPVVLFNQVKNNRWHTFILFMWYKIEDTLKKNVTLCNPTTVHSSSAETNKKEVRF